MALHSRTKLAVQDERFNYEPFLSAHPNNKVAPFDFLGKRMNYPIWISSMTGGSEYSGIINKNLARACNEFGLGMGLGSCRVLLENDKYLDQFDLRPIIGNDYPLYANLGIKQVEKAIQLNNISPIITMVEKLKADGLIIHVNPLQEWLQPEGERITIPPIDTIKTFLSQSNLKIIVKEVGQGFGPESIKALLKLPIEAIELAAFGGTNFAKLELNRNGKTRQELLKPLSLLGNNAYEMTDIINQYVETNKKEVKCKSVIISGGITSFLDGFYLVKKSMLKAVYGQASAFLNHAREDYGMLREFIEYQVEGFKLASSYLTIKQ